MVSCNLLHRRWKVSAICAPSGRMGARDLALSRSTERTQVLVRGVPRGVLSWAARPDVGGRYDRVAPTSLGQCGVMSIIAPPLQSGITRVIRDGAVSRPPLMAWVQLGTRCRVRRVRGACRRLVACASDGHGAGHEGAAVAPERIGGARDQLERPVGTWAVGSPPSRRRPRERSGSRCPAGGTASTSASTPRPAAAPHAGLGDRRPTARASAAAGESAVVDGSAS
jgi:hypothetical protein